MRRTTVLLVLFVTASMLSSAVATAQTRAGDDRSGFRFQFAETEGHRRLALEGSVFNDLPWSVSDVRVQVDCLDKEGTVTSTSTGWVLGTVRSGDRGYFYVPVVSRAASYRVTVQSFNKSSPQAP